MNTAAITGWIAAVVALATLFLMIRKQQREDGKAAMEARLQPIAKALADHDSTLTRHGNDIKELQVGHATLSQRQADHETQDTARFEDIAGMFAEIRKDIKELLLRR